MMEVMNLSSAKEHGPFPWKINQGKTPRRTGCPLSFLTDHLQTLSILDIRITVHLNCDEYRLDCS